MISALCSSNVSQAGLDMKRLPRGTNSKTTENARNGPEKEDYRGNIKGFVSRSITGGAKLRLE